MLFDKPLPALQQGVMQRHKVLSKTAHAKENCTTCKATLYTCKYGIHADMLYKQIRYTCKAALYTCKATLHTPGQPYMKVHMLVSSYTHGEVYRQAA